MNKRELLKRGKGLLAFILAFMVMFGMPIQVLADNYYFTSSDEVRDAISAVGFQGGDVIQVSGGYLVINGQIHPDDEYTLPTGKTYTVDIKDSYNNTNQFAIILSSKSLSGTGTPQEIPTSGDIHEHNFNWELTLEPTETTDGRYDYRCECGYAEGSQPVSFLKVIVDNIIKSIENAPAEGTVIIENKFLRCLTDEIMEALIKRPDVSLEVRFTDQDVPYKFIIPAGQYPKERSEWYGYYYLGSIYGWKE